MLVVITTNGFVADEVAWQNVTFRSRARSLQPMAGCGVRASKPLLALVSDERLAEEIRCGNEAAFEALYERHGAAVLSLCRHILGCPEEAEEALQHAFTAVWSYLQRGRPVPRGCARGCSRSRATAACRYCARASPTRLSYTAPCTVGLADQVERRADLRELLSNLRELPEQQGP